MLLLDVIGCFVGFSSQCGHFDRQWSWCWRPFFASHYRVEWVWRRWWPGIWKGPFSQVGAWTCRETKTGIIEEVQRKTVISIIRQRRPWEEMFVVPIPLHGPIFGAARLHGLGPVQKGLGRVAQTWPRSCSFWIWEQSSFNTYYCPIHGVALLSSWIPSVTSFDFILLRMRLEWICRHHHNITFFQTLFGTWAVNLQSRGFREDQRYHQSSRSYRQCYTMDHPRQTSVLASLEASSLLGWYSGILFHKKSVCFLTSLNPSSNM